MYVTEKFGARWIHPGDAGSFVPASLLVVPSLGLLVGFLELERTSRGWRQGAAVIAALAALLVSALLVLFIIVGVYLPGSGFEGL